MKHKIIGYLLMALLVVGVYALGETIKDIVVNKDTKNFVTSQATATGQTEGVIAGSLLDAGVQYNLTLEKRAYENELYDLTHDCINRGKAKECVNALKSTVLVNATG